MCFVSVSREGVSFTGAVNFCRCGSRRVSTTVRNAKTSNTFTTYLGTLGTNNGVALVNGPTERVALSRGSC